MHRGDYAFYKVQLIYSNGNVVSSDLWDSSGSQINGPEDTFAVRPVVTLKASVKITPNADGTEFTIDADN